MNSAPGQEEQSQAELELKLFLERVVPRPDVPADRVAQVRRRIQRRRRRRWVAAGAGVTMTGMAVLTAVLAGTLSPGAGPRDGGANLPAAANGAGKVGALFDPANPNGLEASVPSGWESLTVTRPGAIEVSYVSSQSLEARNSCSNDLDQTYPGCPLVTGLKQQGVLMSFRMSDEDFKRGKPFVLDQPQPAGKGCRLLGGDTELSGWWTTPHRASTRGTTPSGTGQETAESDDMVFRVDACLRHPSQQTISKVRKILEMAIL